MRFYVRKTVSFVIALVVISFLTFFALQILPGDPALLILGTEGDPVALAALREELGLLNPPLQRFWMWLRGVFAGDLGNSVRYAIPVADLLRRALPLTASVALGAVFLSLAIAVPLGIFCAVHKDGVWDWVGLLFSQFGMAIPAFWMGILLIQLFSLRLGLLPPGGYDGLSLSGLMLPVLALALPRAAILTRMVRSSLLQVLQEDYIRTARSKGVPERRVLFRHALKNSSINICTIAGIQFTQLLAGTIVIEQVFGLPGLGQLLLAGVLQRDLPLVQGLVVLGASMILFANLCFDFILAALDPRIRFE